MMPFPSYDIATELTNGVNMGLLGDEIKALGLTSATFQGLLNHEGAVQTVFDVTPNAADQASVDGAIAAHNPTLPDAKAVKNAAIDLKTRQLIAQGFLHSGKVFSLSAEAQSYWNGLGNLTANGLLTEPDDFPLTVNTLDDSNTHDIMTIAEAVTVFATAAATVKAHLASGTALKDQVRAATTTAEVDAVVDNR